MAHRLLVCAVSFVRLFGLVEAVGNVLFPARSPAQLAYASIRDLQIVTISSNYVFEVQEVVVAGAQGGNFALAVGSRSTGALRHNISSSDLSTALAALSNVTSCSNVQSSRTTVRLARFSCLFVWRGV
jgi:hypothetical protein